MRKRDLGILLIAALAVLVSLQHDHSFSFKESWYHVNEDDHSYPLIHEVESPPPPLVTDLNGDGKKEVIFATRDGQLQVVEPVVSPHGQTYHAAKVMASVSLHPANVRLGTGGQPVAMAAGYLDPPRRRRSGKKKGASRRRKMVVVVVTNGWSVLCYDHNLKLKWETNVQEIFPHGARPKEVAVLISNHTMHHGDHGVVIIGGSMEAHPQSFDDVFEEEEEEETEEGRHRRTAGKKESLEDISGGAPGVNERHFSYHAFDGRTGAARWKHDSKDFHRDIPAMSEQLLPQHNYKLDANALSARHFGEVECRNYRESVLGAMPHHWDSRDDTSFHLAHFRKHRRSAHKKLPGGRDKNHAPGGPARLRAGKEHRGKNPVAHALGRAVEAATSARHPKKHDQHPHGNLTAHMPWAPNAIVAHLKEGIEAIHLYSGRTICKLLLTEGGLHADINGDGVLDHVQASGVREDHGRVMVEGFEEPLQSCWAIATSGVPVREQLFNGSICKSRHNSAFDLDLGEGMFSHEDGLATHMDRIDVATPILLPRQDKHRHRRGSHGDVIFLNSLGEVTSYTTGGLRKKGAQHSHMRWQVSTDASWVANGHHPFPAYNDVFGSDDEHPVLNADDAAADPVPSLKAMSLRAEAEPDVILAVGEIAAVILSSSGHTLAQFQLPTSPVAPVIVADFNGDRLNDIIVTTLMGTYGFVQVRQPGALLLSSLLACLIVVMAVIFVTLHLGSTSGSHGGGAKGGRGGAGPSSRALRSAEEI